MPHAFLMIGSQIPRYTFPKDAPIKCLDQRDATHCNAIRTLGHSKRKTHISLRNIVLLCLTAKCKVAVWLCHMT